MTTKRGISARRKAAILEKQGSCAICGYDVAPILEAHHIVPLENGGQDDETNIVALCPNCHTAVERVAKMNDRYHTTALAKAIVARLVPGGVETFTWLVAQIMDTQYQSVTLELVDGSIVMTPRLASMLEGCALHFSGDASATYHRG